MSKMYGTKRGGVRIKGESGKQKRGRGKKWNIKVEKWGSVRKSVRKSEKWKKILLIQIPSMSVSSNYCQNHQN